MPSLITEPEAIDAGWLTGLLQEQGHDVDVGKFTRRNIGTGQVGQNVRFEITYKRGDGPRSLVGKFASADPTSRQTGVDQGNYTNEVHFYTTLHPLTDIQTPQVLYVDIDPATSFFCLIMEDLHPAVQGDQIEGCSIEQAHLAVTQAARLHGPTWNMASLRDDPVVGDKGEKSITLVDIWNMVYGGFVERYRHRLEDRHLALLERFTPKLEAYMTPPPEQFALTHGDYRLDNMLFGGPYPLAVVDWQTVAINHPLNDVAYFIGAGLQPDARRASERDLVRAYYDALVEQGVSGYEFDTCFDHYRRYSFSGLVMAVIASMIVGQTDRGDDMFMAMATRHADQALDLDAEALLD